VWYYAWVKKAEVSASHLDCLRGRVNKFSDYREIRCLVRCGVLDFQHTILFTLEVSVIGKSDVLINDEITAKEVRLIDSDGNAIGIVSLSEALKAAAEKDLDLVNIAPNAEPPVCKIMDYGKYLFDANKREKEARKKQKVIDIKEVRLSLGIGDHDLQVKVKSAIKFLQDGDKVKLTVKFFGREMNFTAAGEELIKRFADSVADYGTMEKNPKMEGRRMSVMFSPK
jgi:translation initiation factor IF-3